MIVVGGEALVDLVPGKSTVDGGLGSLYPLVPRLGGGPYNVALAAGRLGAPASFLSRVSTDRFGEALVQRLHDSNVDTRLLQRGPEPTTLAVVALADDGSAAYSFYTEGTADRHVADPGPLPDAVTTLSLGTLGMVLEPGASAYTALLHRAAARGVLTVLDPNIRAALITDPDAYRARFRSWLPDVRLLKLSDEDAAWLAPDEPDSTAAARSWIAAGVDAVVLTRGSAGIVAVTAAGEVAAVPRGRSELVDTIGAGDTVHGALLAWLYERGHTDLTALTEADWHGALSYAATAAGITVSRSGAEPPTRAEMSDYWS